VQVDLLQRVVRPIPRIQIGDFNSDAHVRKSPSSPETCLLTR
jgi:hypothetical protein